MSLELMQAATYARQGPAHDVLAVERLPRPDPGRGEVRVRIAASGVNPTDIYARSGARGVPMDGPLVVPNQDGAGIVDAVGPGVPAAWIGRRVWLHMARWRRAYGTAAQWAVVAVDRVAELPGAYPYALGACLGIPWLTADLAVSSLGRVRGRNLLVSAAGGAVGIYAVQIAAALGARVIATVGSADAATRAMRCGAEAVVDFRRDDIAEAIAEATGGRGVDRVVEGQLSANVRSYRHVLGDRARVVIYGTSEPTACVDVSAAIRGRTELRFVYAYAMTRRAREHATERLREMASGGELVHLPIETYPLAAVADAHAAAERGNHGRRVVVEIETGPGSEGAGRA